MSEENVRVVRQMYDAYLAGDIDRALAYFHPDVAADFSVRADTAPTEGRDALGETVATWVSAWADYSERVTDVRGIGDTVCVIATQTGRGKVSGVEIDTTWGQLYTIQNGLITSVTMYASPTDALEAAGLSE